MSSWTPFSRDALPSSPTSLNLIYHSLNCSISATQPWMQFIDGARWAVTHSHTQFFRILQVECTSIGASGDCSQVSLSCHSGCINVKNLHVCTRLARSFIRSSALWQGGRGAAGLNQESRTAAYLIGFKVTSVIYLCKHSYNSSHSIVTLCLVSTLHTH